MLELDNIEAFFNDIHRGCQVETVKFCREIVIEKVNNEVIRVILKGIFIFFENLCKGINRNVKIIARAKGLRKP